MRKAGWVMVSFPGRVIAPFWARPKRRSAANFGHRGHTWRPSGRPTDQLRQLEALRTLVPPRLGRDQAFVAEGLDDRLQELVLHRAVEVLTPLERVGDLGVEAWAELEMRQ